MKRLLWSAALLTAANVAMAAARTSPSGAVLEVEPVPGVAAAVATAEQTLATLRQRGWPTNHLRVRLAANAWDATRANADVLLPTFLGAEDQVFVLVQGVVRKALGQTAAGEAAASLAAAHLAPPGSGLRRQWEAGWQRRLLAGEVEGTALMELVWRTRGDDGLRQLAEESDPWALAAKLLPREAFEASLWEVVLAGLLAPNKLGFTVPPVTWNSGEALSEDALFRFVRPQLRWLELVSDSDAVAVYASRLRQASARVLVLYQDGRFDVAALEAGQELAVPRWGVRQVLLGLLSLPGEGVASLAFRNLRDWPVRLGSVEVTQEDGVWQLAWSVEEQASVDAYLVELWGMEANGLVLRQRELLPTTEGGPAQLLWTCETLREPTQVRVYALTKPGLLALLFATPVLEGPLDQQRDQASENQAN